METAGNTLVEVNGLSFGYEKNMIVLSDISLSLERGKVYALLGAMASGKSTLLKLLARLAKPLSGQIILEGKDVWQISERQFRRCVSIAFQYPDRSIFATTVYDEVVFALKMLYPEKKHMFDSLVKGALLAVGLDESFLKRNPHMLSGGEKRKVSLAATIVHRPQLLLLDEPTAGLDGISAESILSFVADYAKSDNTVLFTTHNLEDISIADEVIILYDGKVHYIDKNRVDYMVLVSYGILPPDYVLYEYWGKYHGCT